MTERVRNFVPVPQVAVHALYADQPDCLQSTAQAKVLQVVEEVKVGQPRPPRLVEVTMERVLVFMPVPQDFVQAA
jgi:hypothetical protein